MKQAKVLVEHLYRGRRRKVGQVYDIARADYPLFVKLGRIEIVPPPEKTVREHYFTTAMEAEPEPVRTKRPYRRKAKAASEE